MAATIAACARSTTSRLAEQHCTPMSPSLSSGRSWSPLKCGMSTSAAGRCEASPKRESNTLAPKPNVIVRSAGSNCAAPLILPAVRSAAVAVSARITSRRTLRPGVCMSSEANCRYFGCGFTMPAWWAPWNGSTWESALADPPSSFA